MSNGKLKIAIIDDGISQDLFEPVLLGSIIINDELSIKTYNMNNQISHGTICANIIHKYFPFLDYFSIKILSDNMIGKSDKLYRALDYCIEQKIQIVHLSIGSRFAKDFIEMQKKINEAALKGLVIISAAHNEDIISYPACLSNVIGVKRDLQNELCEFEFKLNNDLPKGIEFTSFAKHKLYVEGKEKICSNSNSYAAPMITAFVCEIIYNEHLAALNVGQIKDKLIQRCVNYKNDYRFIYPYPDWIYRALVINASESVLNLNTMPACAWFDIVGTISTTNIEQNFLEFSKVNYDTVIVFNFNSKKFLDYNFICKICLKYNKNIVFLDSNLYFNLNSKLDSQIKIWHTSYAYSNQNVINNLKTNFEEVIIKFFLNDIWEVTSFITLFQKAGYTMYCASDSPKGILYGLDYIPYEDHNKILSYLSIKTQKACYDIFIFFIVDNKSFIKMNADLTLYIEENGDEYKIKILDDNDNFKFLQLKKDSVNYYLYQEIIKKFT